MTKIDWPSEICIACLKPFGETGKQRRSEAHVIPKSLGGKLSTTALCESCNNLIGARHEDRLPLVETYAHEIERYAEIVPDFAKQLRKPGRSYVAQTRHGPVTMKRDRRDGALRLVDTKLESGRFKDSRDAAQEIRQRLIKENADPATVEELLGRFKQGEKVRVGEDTFTPHSDDLEPVFASGICLAPDEGCLAIAYLWLACCAGRGVYTDTLNGVRAALISDGATRDGTWKVEHLQATQDGRPRPSAPWHRLLMRKTEPIAVEVTLFARWVSRVTFPTIPLEWPACDYRLDLVTGAETACALGDDGAAT